MLYSSNSWATRSNLGPRLGCLLGAARLGDAFAARPLAPLGPLWQKMSSSATYGGADGGAGGDGAPGGGRGLRPDQCLPRRRGVEVGAVRSTNICAGHGGLR